MIDKYQDFDTMTTTMLNEFVEKILVHERDQKGRQDTGQEVEIYFNFVGKYIPPTLKEAEPTPEEFYGKYGDLRREYLREHRPALWASLVNSGRLDDHLTTIERLAEIRLDKMLPQMMEAAGVTEELKARDQMAWVGLVILNAENISSE